MHPRLWRGKMRKISRQEETTLEAVPPGGSFYIIIQIRQFISPTALLQRHPEWQTAGLFRRNAFMHSASARASPRYIEWRNVEKWKAVTIQRA